MTNLDGNLDHAFADDLQRLQTALDDGIEIHILRYARRLQDNCDQVDDSLEIQWQRLKIKMLNDYYVNELTEWEYNFLNSLELREKILTEKQNAALDRIYNKIMEA